LTKIILKIFSSYAFPGDVKTADADVQAVIKYPTPNGLTEESIFSLCTDVVVNSSVAKKCGRFFDRDIMNAIEMCVLGEYRGPDQCDQTIE
jgi:hypothetical protein